MISDEVVEEVRRRADIVAIISEHVPLKRAGKDYRARCPFHEERTPSFYVVPSKGFYKCFGCGESGDVFSFLMKRLGLGFMDAVRYVAQRVGVEIRNTQGPDEDEGLRAFHEANAFARRFFEQTLWHPERGRRAREYLASRGIGEATAERFGLGYAPDDRQAFRTAAAQHGLDENVLVEAGLLVRREGGEDPYDRFRNRIIFPIESPSGKVVGFGGRVLGEGGPQVPKYLNSPDSPVFRKGEVLYGLSWAKHAIRREAAVLVVEGYMDAVSLAAAGVEHVVAPLGTSLTEEQARLLSRYCRRAFLLFDSDPAGLRATFRAGDLLLAAGVHPLVVTLPPGEDPDSLVRKQGVSGIQQALAGAVDLLDRKLQILEERRYLSSLTKLRGALDRLLPTLRAVRDPALRDLYVARVAEKTGVRRETLEGEIGQPPSASPRPPRVPRPPVPLVSARPLSLGAERELLLLLVQARDFVDRAAERLGPEDFQDPAYREIFQALVADPELAAPPAGMGPVAVQRLQELMEESRRLSDLQKVFEDSVAHMRKVRLERHAHELREALAQETDPSRQEALVRELEELARQRRQIRADWRQAIRPRPLPNDHPKPYGGV